MMRTTLGQRIALLCVAIAVLTGVVAGVVALPLADDAAESGARQTLAKLADAAQATAQQSANPNGGRTRSERILRALDIDFAVIGRTGAVTGTSTLATDSVTAADVTATLAKRSVSARRTVDGTGVYVEIRPTPTGGLALVQVRSQALAVSRQTGRRIALALLIAAAVAVVLGSLVAVRISRSLRRTAAAAREMAHGRREITLSTRGPAEVADVAEAVSSLADALTRSEQRQRQFLLSVSHDLRTPLTAITGYAESLSDGVIPPSESASVGAVVLAESQRLQRLVSDLLDLARLDAQEFRVDLADVDVASFVREAGVVWADRCAAAGVVFRVETPDGDVHAWTDPSRLRQAVDGLLENALRMTPAGQPIVLGLSRRVPDGVPAPADAAAVIEVRDGGPGLSDDDLAVAFEQSALFQRYHGVRQVGTGLGLAIVHRLITRLGGIVVAGHAREGGASFCIVLPGR